MNFASRELSAKLQALGCKSESSFVWAGYKEPVCTGDATFVLFDAQLEGGEPAAFIPQDFIGPSEQARENARIIFERYDWLADPIKHGYLSPNAWRRDLIDLPEDQFWAEIDKAVGER